MASGWSEQDREQRRAPATSESLSDPPAAASGLVTLGSFRGRHRRAVSKALQREASAASAFGRCS